MRKRNKFSAIVLVLAMVPVANAQIVGGQIDTFESNTTLNWDSGITTFDPTVQLGGPGGPLDHYLRIATNGGGVGAGSRLIAFNRNQWVGDYNAAGVSAIAMDLRNFNVPTGMSVRIGFKTLTDFGAPGYVSMPLSIPMDGQWHSVVFPLDSANMVPINFLPPVTPLSSVLAGGNAEFRILHNMNDDLNGQATPPIAAQLGVDNIRAIAVPEPAALALTGLALAWTIGSLRKSRKQRAE